ncbi:MAG: Rieske 2Fe-2S domain-containing protein [Acidimicrobiia bacterium]
MLLIIVIAILLLAGLGAVLFTLGGKSSKVGTLSRETVSRDKTSRAAATSGDAMAGSTEIVPSEGQGTPPVPVRTPIDEEALGLNRRKFLNRSLLAMVGLGGLAPFGASLLAFIWPPDKRTPVWNPAKKRVEFVPASAGFGGIITAGSAADIAAYIAANRAPFYVPEARAYLRPYPRPGAKPDEVQEALAKAKKVYSPPIVAGMEAGWTALFQKCVHLGCKVPWCGSSQWFECPCHGSKYNAVGEKQGGPAPRGLDLFAVKVGGTITIDTGVVISGPAIGTDTTGQKAEGPSCV